MTAADQPRRLPGKASTCRDCRQPIVFALTDQGRRMPLDPITDPNGNVLVTVLDSRLHCRVLGRGVFPEPWELLAMPHWKTCIGSRDRKAGRKSRNSPYTQPTIGEAE